MRNSAWKCGIIHKIWGFGGMDILSSTAAPLLLFLPGVISLSLPHLPFCLFIPLSHVVVFLAQSVSAFTPFHPVSSDNCFFYCASTLSCSVYLSVIVTWVGPPPPLRMYYELSWTLTDILNKHKWQCLDILFICVYQCACVFGFPRFFQYSFCPSVHVCAHRLSYMPAYASAGTLCAVCLNSCIHSLWMWWCAISTACKSPGREHIKPLSKSSWAASILLSSWYKYLVRSINTPAF